MTAMSDVGVASGACRAHRPSAALAAIAKTAPAAACLVAPTGAKESHRPCLPARQAGTIIRSEQKANDGFVPYAFRHRPAGANNKASGGHGEARGHRRARRRGGKGGPRTISGGDVPIRVERG